MCRKQPGVAIGRLCEKCKSLAEMCCLDAQDERANDTSLLLFSFSHWLSQYTPLIFIFVHTHTHTGDGLCCICNSFVNPHTLVHVCEECNYGSLQGRCVICGNPGVCDAYYCRECVQQEKDRDGCPKIVNLGSTKTDLFYERKKYGFKKR